jgi:hypothetical protein
MTRPRPTSPPARFLLAALAPGERGVPTAWRGVLGRGGLLAAAAADPALARAVPAVAGRLAREGLLPALPAADRATAEVARAWGAARAFAIGGALADVGAACARARVPALLCKGPALHGLLYDDPADRPSADADLFVPERDVLRFHAEAEAIGFRPGPGTAERVEALRRATRPSPWLVDLCYARGDAVLEVKSDPVGMGPPVRRLDELAARATPSPAHPGLLVPAAEAQALQQACSLARRALPDLLAHAELAGVLVARRAELDPARLVGLVAGEGLGGVVGSVLADVEALFPGSVLPALAAGLRRAGGPTPARLRRGAFAPGARETAWTQPALWAAHAIGARRPGVAARWGLARLFPPEPLLAHLNGRPRGPLSARVARVASLLRRAAAPA